MKTGYTKQQTQKMKLWKMHLMYKSTISKEVHDNKIDSLLEYSKNYMFEGEFPSTCNQFLYRTNQKEADNLQKKNSTVWY